VLGKKNATSTLLMKNKLTYIKYSPRTIYNIISVKHKAL
jgi:hypothetical protein